MKYRNSHVLRLFLLEKMKLRAVHDFCPKQMSKREKTALVNTLKFIENHEGALIAMMDPSDVEEIESYAAKRKSDLKTTYCDSTETDSSDIDVVPHEVALTFKGGDKMRKIPVANVG